MATSIASSTEELIKEVVIEEVILDDDVNEEDEIDEEIIDQSKGRKRERIRSLFIVHLSMLILSLGSSIIYTGVWPYILQMEPDVSLDEYGFVVAADAAAQMIFSPIFGMVADKMGSVRFISILCTVTFTGGNVFYALLALIPRDAGGLPKPRVWAMLVSRFIVGIGTSINATARAYVSKVTTLKERTTHVSLLSLFQTLGFIMGPAIQAALTPLGEQPIKATSDIVFDMYTSTGWVSALNGAIATIIFMPGIFVEYVSPTQKLGETDSQGIKGYQQRESYKPVSEDDETLSKEHEHQYEQNRRRSSILSQKPKEVIKRYSSISMVTGTNFKTDEDLAPKSTKRPDLVASIVCTWSFFTFFCSFVTVEVLLNPMAMDHWGWSQEDTILYLGIILAAGGVLTGFCFALIGPLSKRIDERLLLILGGVLMMIVGRAIMFPFPGNGKPPFNGNYTECGYPEPDTTYSMMEPFAGPVEGGGCRYCWCLEQPKMTVTQFIIGMALTMIGYPFCTAIIASIYSKVLGDIPQGFWMGLLTTSGSIARVVGPIFFTFVYEYLGTYVTFGILIGVLGFTMILCILSYNRFKPRQT